MELIDRYVYAVVKRLPEKQRKDIEKELRGLIEDMLSQRTKGAPPTDKDVEAVLLELGDPAKLAGSYRESKRYLIGPEIFDMYLLVLKIVLIAVAAGMTIAIVVRNVFTPPSNALTAFGEFLASLFSGIAGGFTWVTIMFGVFEHVNFKDKSKIGKNTPWQPSKLPPIPKNESIIRKGDPIGSIVFTLLVLVVLNGFPALIGVWFHTDAGFVSVPVFSQTAFYKFLPLIDAVLLLSLAKECWKLLQGRWNLTLAVGNGLYNLIGIVLAVNIFLPPGIWNTNFLSELALYATNLSADTMGIIGKVLSIGPLVFTGLVVFGHVIDTIMGFVKALQGYFVKEAK